MHTLLLLHLRAYTNLKNYATVEIHLSGWIYSLRSQNILWTIGILCTSSRSESSMALLYHLASKQLLDEVFFDIRNNQGRGKSYQPSRRQLRLIILTETLFIQDITKTESYNCFIIHRLEENNEKHRRKETELILLLEIMHCARSLQIRQLYDSR